MRKKLFTFLCSLIFMLTLSVFATGQPVEAASKNTVRSVAVRIDNKKATKKTYTLDVGKSKNLKVTVSPKKAMKSIRYKSSNLKIVSVSKKGKITAKKKGTAKIQITVTGKDRKKKSTWVKVKAVNPKIQSISVRIDNKNVAGTVYSLERGGWKDLKVDVMPAKSLKSIQYVSGNASVANVDQKGTVIARNTGTARITVTALNKDNKKKSVWVDIRVTERSQEPTPTPEPTPEPTPVTPGNSKILVAYFSATNTTEKIAGYIADGLPADLYEIDPAVPYTSADLNYSDADSRSSIEMNDPNARPAISTIIENMDQYDTVFLGYPIWWGQAPRIISTFLESYNFSGKKIIPFCTSGSSGIGLSATNLHSLASGAEWMQGQRFSGSASHDSVTEWVNSLGLVEKPEPEPEPTPDPEPGTSNILITYFSLSENTENAANVDATTSASVVVDDMGKYGTTEYVAQMIQKKVGGDLHSIQTKQKYPDDFDAVVDQNHQEMQDGVLPELVQSNLDISRYDTVFIGYPVWATNAPQAVLSFLKQYDMSGKKVVPFCTHDGYGAGSSYRTISNACPQAEVLSGIAIAAKDVSAAESTLDGWLADIGITGQDPDPEPTPDPEPEGTPIKITVGNTALDGVIYDTALAEEIKEHFPLTVSMSGYGGREYYGGLSFTPGTSQNGQLNFENGDITYCRTNNTMAIFYAQTDRPNLTMEVVPIGRVTSDLSVFSSLGSREDVTFSLADAGTDDDSDEKDDADKNKVLVAYFSATNTTEKLAEYLSYGLEAELYEIVPAVPYTSADLNYGDSSSRTSMEMNDVNARPEISGSVADMGQYDTVFLGYPIWWGQAPRIISTFLESYDLSGKTIIPFCTSGSSGIGSSATNLHSLASGANWLSGRRFSSNASQNDMIQWAESLGLEATK